MLLSLSIGISSSMKMQLRWLATRSKQRFEPDHYCLSYACMFWFLWSLRVVDRAHEKKTMGFYKIEPKEWNLCLLGEPACCREFIERLRSLRRVLKWSRERNNWCCGRNRESSLAGQRERDETKLNLGTFFSWSCAQFSSTSEWTVSYCEDII